MVTISKILVENIFILHVGESFVSRVRLGWPDIDIAKVGHLKFYNESQ